MMQSVVPWPIDRLKITILTAAFALVAMMVVCTHLRYRPLSFAAVTTCDVEQR